MLFSSSQCGRWIGVSLISVLLLLPACVSENQSKAPVPAPASAGRIQEINLLALPMALDFDGLPGVDGFVLKIYATNRKATKPLPLDDGKVEVLMYDGIPNPSGPGLQPAKIWTFTATELKRYEIHTSIGVGYQLSLLWGEAKPSRNRISVIARYTSAAGAILTSAPSVIAVAVK